MASVAEDRSGGIVDLLREAIAQLRDPRWPGIAVAFLLFLGATNAVLALYKPEAGARPGLPFALAGLVRVLALIAISVAALRIATASERRRWLPDGGFWLYLALSLIGLAAAALGAGLGAPLPEAGRILATELAGVLLTAPLAVWTVAAATERPLALAPGPRFRGLGRWLPALLVWSALLVVPLACLHAFLSLKLLATAGTGAFWPLAAADAMGSTLLVLLGLALRVAAYRRVARG
ncbi:MAG TPA: hypothetical protein VF718_03670 [Allosphingosinicella sp.]|jgi:hypothetical protein